MPIFQIVIERIQGSGCRLLQVIVVSLEIIIPNIFGLASPRVQLSYLVQAKLAVDIAYRASFKRKPESAAAPLHQAPRMTKYVHPDVLLLPTNTGRVIRTYYAP